MNARMTSNQCVPRGDARIAKQAELERMYSKNQLTSRIKAEFVNEKNFDFAAYMVANGIDPEFGFGVMTQMVLYKRTNLPTLVGIMRGHFKNDHNASQLTADMLLKCAMADLVDWAQDLNIFVIKFDVTPDVQRELDMYQFPLPMVTEPKLLKTNRSSPYMAVKDGSVILRNNHHDDDICLDHLNMMNRVKLCINETVARMVKNQWRNHDKPKEGETKKDFERRRRAFDKYDRTAKQVMDQVTELGNEFYLTHKVDKRGRTYCQGYHISYQSAPWNKAVVELADKELIP